MVMKNYSSLIVQHPLITIIAYMLLLISFSFGLFHVQFKTDSESLISVKDSQFQSDIKAIQSHFKEDHYQNYFQHQLLSLGYYIEVIISLKCLEKFEKDNLKISFNECNMLNQTYLNDYNKFYDSIMTLSISDYDNQSKVLTYDDLCPKRTNKCAIEGGILRSDLFKKKLLNNKIGYSKNDPTRIFIDSEIVDGTSIDFLFGKFRKENCEEYDCFVNGSLVIRNRFDFISNSLREQRLAIKFMHKFVEHMKDIEKSKKYENFGFSYHTSHTLAHEIEHYSKLDLKYVVIALMVFFFVYYILMLCSLSNFKLFVTKTIINYANKSQNTVNKRIFKILKCSHLTLMKKPLFLIVVSILQFFFTLSSSLGLMSLFGVEANELLFSILFVILSE